MDETGGLRDAGCESPPRSAQGCPNVIESSVDPPLGDEAIFGLVDPQNRLLVFVLS